MRMFGWRTECELEEVLTLSEPLSDWSIEKRLSAAAAA